MTLTLKSMNCIKMKLKEYREYCALSQADAARKMGVSRQAWHQWETGERNPGIKVMQRLCMAFHCFIKVGPLGWEIEPLYYKK